MSEWIWQQLALPLVGGACFIAGYLVCLLMIDLRRQERCENPDAIAMRDHVDQYAQSTERGFDILAGYHLDRIKGIIDRIQQ